MYDVLCCTVNAKVTYWVHTIICICENNAAQFGTEEVQQTGGADEFGFADFPEQSEKPAKADSFEDDYGFGDQEPKTKKSRTKRVQDHSGRWIPD